MKRAQLYVAPWILVLLLARCSSNSGDWSEAEIPVVPPTGPMALVEFHLDSLTYEEITGYLQPGEAGMMLEDLDLWPRYSSFGLIVPEGAVPYPVDFTMRIPTQDSYEYWKEVIGDELIIRLSPANTHFLEPITVLGTWMPWRGKPIQPLSYSSGSTTGPVDIIYDAVHRRYRVSFQVDHFSDWRVRPNPPKF